MSQTRDMVPAISIVGVQRWDYSKGVGTRTFDGVRFAAWADDHLPIHVHGFYAGVRVIVELRDDNTIRLATRRNAVRPQSAKRSDVIHVLRQPRNTQTIFCICGEWPVAKWEMTTTDAEIDNALQEARNSAPEPEAVSVEYLGGSADMIVIRLNMGGRVAIPREYLQGLDHATEAELAEIEIHSGVDIAWPQLNVDYYLPYLLEHRYGSKAWMETLQRRGVAA